MKIDPTNHLHTSRTSESKPDKSDSRAQTNPVPDDRSALSTLAQHLNAQGARQQRIEALRAAVENGTYKFSSTDLAESLIKAHSLDLNKRD